MIDQLVECDEGRSQTTFLISQDNVLIDNNQLTEAGLVENIAQTAAAGVGYMARRVNKPVLIGYIGAIKNLEIFALPNVGDVIETEVTIEHQVFDITIISGTVNCNGVLMAKCEMKIFIKK
jgi:predicted hotdog family 3-hydroxylacyl-ACP dehydratase